MRRLCRRLRKDITSTQRLGNFTIAADSSERYSATKQLRVVARDFLPDKEGALPGTPAVPLRSLQLHILAEQNL